ncbi:hypothetical protein [Streptomyces sp. CBMA156]|uniref:DUF7919 family protein n=1 Tax=Streptomyces sp. CBMA156 TaxID=1930280 RepID=UPI00294FFB5B|nr:hypothetical protein [Streptomyces sp. CBMA156]
MTFYEDMSPYAYWHRETFTDTTTGCCFLSFQPQYERLNIGWLSGDQPWASGVAPADFIDRLEAVLAVQAVNEMLGLHDCELCPPSEEQPPEWYKPRPGHRRSSAGTGEIRIPGGPGAAFAAPTLIGHYVIDHGYVPPKAFVDAVLAFDPSGHTSAEYPWMRFPWVPTDAVLYDASVE